MPTPASVRDLPTAQRPADLARHESLRMPTTATMTVDNQARPQPRCIVPTRGGATHRLDDKVPAHYRAVIIEMKRDQRFRARAHQEPPRRTPPSSDTIHVWQRSNSLPYGWTTPF